MLAFQNSKNGHNWGQEAMPEAPSHPCGANGGFGIIDFDWAGGRKHHIIYYVCWPRRQGMHYNIISLAMDRVGGATPTARSLSAPLTWGGCWPPRPPRGLTRPWSGNLDFPKNAFFSRFRLCNIVFTGFLTHRHHTETLGAHILKHANV